MMKFIARFPLLLPLGLALAGCAGRARLEFAALDFKSIDPPAALVSRIDFPQCYWWENEAGRLCVATEKQFTIPFNKQFRFELQMSLELEKLPAGKARNYVIGRREMRARVKFGAWESRLSSVAGIAAVYRESGDRLRGSLRMRTSRVSSELFGGWGEPATYLMLGTFTAVHDEARGRKIADLTESQGWQRTPTDAPDSRPADPPAPASDDSSNEPSDASAAEIESV